MYDMCFACGKDNPISLKLKFKAVTNDSAVEPPTGIGSTGCKNNRSEKETLNKSNHNMVRAEFEPSAEHQGYEGIIHGGIISTLLDEAMVSAIINTGIEAVTAELNIRFKGETHLGEKLRIEGYITKQKSRLIFTEGRVLNENGELKAKANAKFMVIKAGTNI